MKKYSFEIGNDIKNCITCRFCMGNMTDEYDTTCRINFESVSLLTKTRPSNCPLIEEVEQKGDSTNAKV